MAILALLLLGILLPSPTVSQAGNTTLPLSLTPRVLTGTDQTCPPDEVREMTRSQIDQDIRALLRDNTICPTTGTQASPAASCSAISTSCPSGYYWVRSCNGSAVQVYCDMDRVCGCNSTGGWARVAYLNTTDTSQQCPGTWTLITTPRRTCGRTRNVAICDSAIFPSSGIQYNHICGRVIGYQYGHPDGNRNSNRNIETYYVDGVSITHGAPGSRQHIWTFSAAVFPNRCPCSGTGAFPSFIGDDYFCETGNDNSAPFDGGVFFPDDPLWDGLDCGTTASACECTTNGPPWFCKQLPQATTDDIEVRICADDDIQFIAFEDTPVELIELYIR